MARKAARVVLSGRLCLVVGACLLVLAPRPARAFELSGGVSAGVLAAGVLSRLAISPHATMAWRMESGLQLGAHEVLNILPATSKHGPGAYNQISVDLGYGWENFNMSAGPSLAVFTMVACRSGPNGCKRLEGVLPGVHAQANLYFVGPLGLSLWGSVDWIVEGSDVLSGVTAMVAAGPVLRWRTK